MFTIILLTFATADLHISKAPKWAYKRQHPAPRPYPSSSLETPILGTEDDYGPFTKAPKGHKSCKDAKGFYWKENALLLNSKMNKASLCRPSGNWLNYDTCGGQWDPRQQEYTGSRLVIYDPEQCWAHCDKNGTGDKNECSRKLCTCVSPMFQVGACDPDAPNCIVRRRAALEPEQRRRVDTVWCIDEYDCGFNYRCSNSGGFCVHKYGGSAGEACNQNAHCASGHRCSNSGGFCVRDSGNFDGEKCFVDVHCERGHNCVLNALTDWNICRTPISSEEPCNFDYDCSNRQESCRISPTATYVPGKGEFRKTCQFDASLATLGRRLDMGSM